MGRIQSLFSNPLGLLYMIPAVLIGLTFHEWAHAFAAYKLGDPTARNLGRMSLNPLVHLDPFGLICMILLGFGWAKPVPVNPRNFKHFRRDDMIVSLAGVTANLVIVLIFSLLFVLFLRVNPALWGNAAFLNIFLGIIQLNTCLCVFNLIPISPLDGSHVLENLLGRHLPNGYYSFMARFGRWVLLALLWSGILSYPITWANNLVLQGINLLLNL